MENQTLPRPRLILEADTAADLMTPSPVSLDAEATAKEAVAFLTEKGFHGAPVIDEACRPVGVLSRSDLVSHDRERGDCVLAGTYLQDREDLGRCRGDGRTDGFEIVSVDRTPIRELMTPMVFTVRLDTPAGEVVQELLTHKIQRLFVVDDDGVLVGVVSVTDVLRCLHGHSRARPPGVQDDSAGWLGRHSE